MTASPEVRDVLLDAATLIESEGWTQGVSRDDDGSRCAGRAIQDAAPSVSARNHAWDFFRDALGRQHRGRGLIGWNDSPGRTQVEVVAKLRDVAAS